MYEVKSISFLCIDDSFMTIPSATNLREQDHRQRLLPLFEGVGGFPQVSLEALRP
jgi:hypothetical protein